MEPRVEQLPPIESSGTGDIVVVAKTTEVVEGPEPLGDTETEINLRSWSADIVMILTEIGLGTCINHISKPCKFAKEHRESPSLHCENWPPSIKMRDLENCQSKMGLKGCKWSSLNSQGTPIPLSHPFLELGELPLLIISPLG